MNDSRRTFTYEEALALLPEVRRLTGEAVKSIDDDPAGEGDSGGDVPEVELSPESQKVIADWAGAIMNLGIEVKGLWLVDFDSGSGYYCWRYPEESLQYFHGYDEGFGGRVRLN